MLEKLASSRRNIGKTSPPRPGLPVQVSSHPRSPFASTQANATGMPHMLGNFVMMSESRTHADPMMTSPPSNPGDTVGGGIQFDEKGDYPKWPPELPERKPRTVEFPEWPPKPDPPRDPTVEEMQEYVEWFERYCHDKFMIVRDTTDKWYPRFADFETVKDRLKKKFAKDHKGLLDFLSTAHFILELAGLFNTYASVASTGWTIGEKILELKQAADENEAATQYEQIIHDWSEAFAVWICRFESGKTMKVCFPRVGCFRSAEICVPKHIGCKIVGPAPGTLYLSEDISEDPASHPPDIGGGLLLDYMAEHKEYFDLIILGYTKYVVDFTVQCGCGSPAAPPVIDL